MKIYEIIYFLQSITRMRQFSIMQAFTALCAIKIDDMAPILKSLTNHQDFAIFDQVLGTTTDQMCEFIYIS